MNNQRLLDKTFKVSLVLKGLDGLLELFGGLILIFISPQTIESAVRFLTQHELSTDPNDLIATHLLHSTSALTSGSLLFSAVYLVSHGLVKIILVTAVLKNRLWAYPWMIGFLLVFIMYQIYRMSIAFTVSMLLLTLFDAFIVWLTVLEYQKHKLGRQKIETT